MNVTDQLIEELKSYADSEKAAFLPKFFQAFPGGYGEGDTFLGVTVPDQRRIAKNYYKLVVLTEIEKLLRQPVHEYRLTALFLLVYKYEKLTFEPEKKEIVDLYLRNTGYVNNWDLVDSSAYKILGPYLFDKSRDILYELASKGHIWEQRIAVISTYYFIRQNDFNDTLQIAAMLLNHRHDLIHKAVGWMLREVGNRDFDAELKFLKEHYKDMPRTMLRYAIEKFNPELRQKFLKGEL